MNEQDLLDSALALDEIDLSNLSPLGRLMHDGPDAVLNAIIEGIKEEVDPDPVEEEVIKTDPVTGKRVFEVYNDGKISKKLEQMHRMCQVSSKFASTLALRHIRADVSTEVYGDAPAWSDSESITFQQNKIGDLTDPESVTTLKGLTLHELAHILLTPRNGSIINKTVQKEGLWRAFNALEDQRIEMYMTTKYGSTKDWLVAVIARHLLQKPSQVVVAYPLTHGRKYLPKDLRDAVRNAYEKQEDVVELGQLIDKYVQLNLGDPSTYDEALDIIRRYHELIENLMPRDPDKPWHGSGWNKIADPNGHDHRKENEWKSSSSSKPANKAEQASVIARMSMGEGEGDRDNSLESSNESTNQKGSAGDGSEDSQGQTAGSGGDGALRDIARRVLDDVLNKRKADIATTIKQYSGEIELSSKPLPEPKRPEWEYLQSVSAATVQASKSFGGELVRLRADHDPGWDRRVEAGKLNIQRYVTGCDVDEAFDQWDMGREDAVDIECVILLDTSGSMGGVIREGYESMWAIKRALDKINASTTVLLYSHKTEVLYSSNERAGIQMKYAGLGNSTEPLKALRYARSVLGNSKRAIKICIAITDGWWDDAKECDGILQQFRKAGVLTALAYMDSTWDWHKNDPNYTPRIDSHGCEVAVHVTEPRDLFTLAKSMVKAGVRRNLGE